MQTIRRVALIGLDSLPPEIVLGRWRNELPTLDGLIRSGSGGVLRSCIPPITVPAWSCMLASKDPGQLVIYGFRNRTDYSYAGLGLTTSRAVRERRVWDILGSEGLRSIVIGVPGTYPPPTITGELVADFLTPDRSVDYTFPRALKDEI